MSLLRVCAALLIALVLRDVRRQRPGEDQDPLHPRLEVSGPARLHLLGQGQGLFRRKEGLDVTIDQGTGSAATVTRIVSGTYDAGFGDMNAIIQFAGTKPGQQPVMVYMIYNTPPFALITKASTARSRR